MPTAIQMSQAMDLYRSHMVARGMAKATIKNSSQVITKAIKCWGDIQPQNIQPRHIDRLFQENDWSPRTVNLYLGTLRQFLTWCRSNGYMHRDADPTVGWRNVRVPSTERMRVPVEEFPSLLDAARHPRDRACIAVGLFCFLRGGELATLKISDLDLMRHELAIYRHKTKEEDVLPVCVELREEMVRWLNWYRDVMGTLQPHWYLLPAKHKDTFIRDDFLGRLVWDGNMAPPVPTKIMSHPYRPAQRALAQLGYEVKGEGEHTLRRSGARALFDQLRSQGYDGSLMRVSSMLGHKDTRVTERYIGIGLERTQRNEMLAGEIMFPSIKMGNGALKAV